METLLYLAKVNLYWVLFYLTYRLLLCNHTFFHWNRIYLIGSLLIAFLLPLVTFPEAIVTSQPAIYAAASLPYMAATEPVSLLSDWISILLNLLAVGSLYLLSVFIKSIRAVVMMIKQHDVLDMDRLQLVLLPHNDVGSFSFFKWLVMNRRDYEQNFEPILRHESVHIHQMHSLDILFIELLKIAFWFNPVLWFYKRSLQEVHEYLADEHAPDRDGYARFLVAYAFNAPAAALTNHFFNGPLLKSRIKMIYKNRNAEWLRSKYFIVLPLVCIVLVTTAARERIIESIEKITPAAVGAMIVEQEKLADLKAVKPIKHPKVEKAASKSIKTEKTKKFNASFASSKSLTSLMPDTLPESSTKKATFSNYRYAANIGPIAKMDSFPKIGATISIRGYNGPGSNALIIVDGAKQEQRGSMGYNQIKPDQIESINVLKNQSAVDVYGDEGKEGVIIIKTKK
ncbi:TonB-dependent receptor plug domain-containing protein [Dyadobacter sp. LJ53]|uniref:M56 family metallopeptidase n=1 Tax=Dyadobacter chenwenxiniae TaxID=2906456 RepID=UPI001F45D964|nr:TonB-dependent receptor plug domain-containing protein [Dyadobacter chenwenxiniae]MCF0051047.1 TonB-dependent receptor plug domain-containing protein [Dyadobacter chenwenxiniae]